MTEEEKLSNEDFEKIENLICGTKAETLAEIEEKKTRLELSEKLNKYIFLLEKENEELKTTISKMETVIEKMKCCGNCKYYRYTGTCMNDDEEVAGDCSCDKWELAE